MAHFSIETVALLSTMAGMSQQVQGMIDKSTGAIVHFSAGAEDFESLSGQMPICVERLSILQPQEEKEEARKKSHFPSTRTGTQVHGAFQVQGSFVRTRGGVAGDNDDVASLLGTGRILRGQELIPPGLRASDGVYLLFFSAAKTRACMSTDLVAFGTQSVQQPLAPTTRYVRSLCDYSIEKAAIACSNGVYTLSIQDSAAFLRRSHVYENLMNLQYVCTLSPASPSSKRRGGRSSDNNNDNDNDNDNNLSGGRRDTNEDDRHGRDDDEDDAVVRRRTLYRISANALAVGKRGDATRIEEIQRILRTTADARTYLQTGSSHFSFTKGIVDFRGKVVARAKVEEAIKTVCGGDDREGDQLARIRNEPLLRWLRPTQVLKLAVSVAEVATFRAAAAAAGDSDSCSSSSFSERFLALKGKVGVIVSTASAKVRGALPGESATAPTTQLRRVISEAVKGAVRAAGARQRSSDGGAAAPSSSAPWTPFFGVTFSQSLGDEIRDQLQSSGLYKEQVKVTIETKIVRGSGKATHLPNGWSALIPDYARRPDSARVAVITEALCHLGIEARFTSWDTASTNGLRIIA